MLKRDLEKDRLYFRNRYYEKKGECYCKDEEIRILKKALELACWNLKEADVLNSVNCESNTTLAEKFIEEAKESK